MNKELEAMIEHYFEFRGKYAGNLFIDLEANQIDETEAIDKLKNFNEIVTNELKERFDKADDEFDILDIIDNDSDEIFTCNKFSNENLLFLYAIKSESIDLLRYLHNESNHFKFWSLPISPLEYAQRFGLEKAVTFLRRY